MQPASERFAAVGRATTQTRLRHSFFILARKEKAMQAYRKVLPVLLAVMLISSACGSPAAAPPPATVRAGVLGNGNVVSLGLMDTCRYLMQVFRADPGTFIMQSDEGDFLFAWSMGANQWGFLAVNSVGGPITNLLRASNASNTLTFTGLVQHLESEGWQYVTPAAIPGWLGATFGSVSAFVIRYGDMLASPIPMFLILMPVPGEAVGNT
jgi:hypothetical protein